MCLHRRFPRLGVAGDQLPSATEPPEPRIRRQRRPKVQELAGPELLLVGRLAPGRGCVRTGFWCGDLTGSASSDRVEHPRGGIGMGSLRQDVRYTLRNLRATPFLALVAIVTLSLGIGANVAIFSVVDTSMAILSPSSAFWPRISGCNCLPTREFLPTLTSGSRPIRSRIRNAGWSRSSSSPPCGCSVV